MLVFEIRRIKDHAYKKPVPNSTQQSLSLIYPQGRIGTIGLEKEHLLAAPVHMRKLLSQERRIEKAKYLSLLTNRRSLFNLENIHIFQVLSSAGTISLRKHFTLSPGPSISASRPLTIADSLRTTTKKTAGTQGKVPLTLMTLPLYSPLQWSHPLLVQLPFF